MPDFRAHLHKGERVLWQGRPVRKPPSARHIRSETALTLAVIAGLGWAYFALSGYPVPRLAIMGVLILLAAVLFLPLILAAIATRRYLRRTAYAITSKRALILSGKQLFAQPLNANTRYRLSGKVPETLEIWDAREQARAEVPPLRFQQLPNGAAATVLEGVISGVSPPDR